MLKGFSSKFPQRLLLKLRPTWMTSSQNSWKKISMWKERVWDRKCPVTLRETWIWHTSEVISLRWLCSCTSTRDLSCMEPGHGPGRWNSTCEAGEQDGLQVVGDGGRCRGVMSKCIGCPGKLWQNPWRWGQKNSLDHLFLTGGQLWVSVTFWEPHDGTSLRVRKSTFSARTPGKRTRFSLKVLVGKLHSPIN